MNPRELRKRIVRELIEQERLDSDEEISLGCGGAKPNGSPKKERKAYIIVGLPASGKSSIVNTVANRYGAYVVDSDFAKRKFPEFSMSFGANLVHEESQLVTFGSNESRYQNEFNLFEYCVSEGNNMIIPKIGYNSISIEKTRNTLIEKYGYEVHLTLVSLERSKATIRALLRYLKTERYVPLSLVFDCYANDPILSYYRTKQCDKWASFGKVSSDVGIGQPPKFIEGTEGNPSLIFE